MRGRMLRAHSCKAESAFEDHAGCQSDDGDEEDRNGKHALRNENGSRGVDDRALRQRFGRNRISHARTLRTRAGNDDEGLILNRTAQRDAAAFQAAEGAARIAAAAPASYAASARASTAALRAATST